MAPVAHVAGADSALAARAAEHVARSGKRDLRRAHVAPGVGKRNDRGRPVRLVDRDRGLRHRAAAHSTGEKAARDQRGRARESVAGWSAGDLGARHRHCIARCGAGAFVVERSLRRGRDGRLVGAGGARLGRAARAGRDAGDAGSLEPDEEFFPAGGRDPLDAGRSRRAPGRAGAVARDGERGVGSVGAGGDTGCVLRARSGAGARAVAGPRAGCHLARHVLCEPRRADDRSGLGDRAGGAGADRARRAARASGTGAPGNRGRAAQGSGQGWQTCAARAGAGHRRRAASFARFDERARTRCDPGDGDHGRRLACGRRARPVPRRAAASGARRAARCHRECGENAGRGGAGDRAARSLDRAASDLAAGWPVAAAVDARSAARAGSGRRGLRAHPESHFAK